ncbi:MAG: hypothetical protein JWO67_6528 [Streptosporangiaceae bacterium]|nr:hypothetical protein [Streptosporangiaceae bacterium]
MVPQWRDPRHRAGGRSKTLASALTGALVVAVMAAAVWDVRPWRQTAPRLDVAGAPQISPDNPFAGSPAASYAVGEAGVKFPPAKAMNGLSASDMALAFVQVKKMFVAANLDPDTLFKGRPDGLAKVLDPDQRRHLLRNLGSRDLKKNTRWWLTSFAPKTAQQTGHVIKVRGATTVRKATSAGVRGVTVKMDYNLVYAVHRPGRPASVIRVVVRRTDEVFVERAPSGIRLWLSWTTRSPAPARCDKMDGFIYPLYDHAAPMGSEPSGAPVDPYDLAERRQSDVGCHEVTRT